MDDFNSCSSSSSSPSVLLLSLRAGGVGLNLVGANHLFLLDMHWNPALEAQAVDRIYRVGQNKPVFIHKFICKVVNCEAVFIHEFIWKWQVFVASTSLHSQIHLQVGIVKRISLTSSFAGLYCETVFIFVFIFKVVL